MPDSSKLVELLLSVGVTFLAFGLFHIASLFYPCYASPLKRLPGLRSKGLIFGNLKDVSSGDFHKVGIFECVSRYGRSFRIHWVFSAPALVTMDTKALHHILSQSETYGKSEEGRYQLKRFLGPGVLLVDGEQHKYQRKILNPAFGTAQIRALTDIFLAKSLELRDKWISLTKHSPNETQRVDVVPWLNCMTLDIIGLAGFNYDFDAMEDNPIELADAFAAAFTSGPNVRSPLAVLQGYIPALRIICSGHGGARPFVIARQTMLRIGSQLISEAKRSAEKSDTSKDLLSLLVRENLANTVSRMSDEEILAQVPTFLTAGHETTSASLAWCLYALSNSQDIQDELRSELLDVTTETPTMDELNSLQYLDKVVKEVLRLHAPVPAVRRTTMKDDAIPVGSPYTGTKGVQRDTITIRKGDTIMIPITAMHRDKAIWGEDVLDFKPDRWDKLPDAVYGIPSIWGNLLTFSTGTRACIGYRFFVVETKAVLYTLVRSFIFKPAVSAEEVVAKMGIVQRPMLKGSPEAGGQLPLIIRPFGLSV